MHFIMTIRNGRVHFSGELPPSDFLEVCRDLATENADEDGLVKIGTDSSGEPNIEFIGKFSEIFKQRIRNLWGMKIKGLQMPRRIGPMIIFMIVLHDGQAKTTLGNPPAKLLALANSIARNNPEIYSQVSSTSDPNEQLYIKDVYGEMPLQAKKSLIKLWNNLRSGYGAEKIIPIKNTKKQFSVTLPLFAVLLFGAIFIFNLLQKSTNSVTLETNHSNDVSQNEYHVNGPYAYIYENLSGVMKPVFRLKRWQDVRVDRFESGFAFVDIENISGWVPRDELSPGTGAEGERRFCIENAGQPPQNGEVLENAGETGPHFFSVENNDPDGFLVRLVQRNGDGRRLFYVQGNDKTEISGISDGVYDVVIIKDWLYSRECEDFFGTPTVFLLDEPVAYVTERTGSVTRTWRKGIKTKSISGDIKRIPVGDDWAVK